MLSLLDSIISDLYEVAMDLRNTKYYNDHGLCDHLNYTYEQISAYGNDIEVVPLDDFINIALAISKIETDKSFKKAKENMVKRGLTYERTLEDAKSLIEKVIFKKKHMIQIRKTQRNYIRNYNIKPMQDEQEFAKYAGKTQDFDKKKNKLKKSKSRRNKNINPTKRGTISIIDKKKRAISINKSAKNIEKIKEILLVIHKGKCNSQTQKKLKIIKRIFGDIKNSLSHEILQHNRSDSYRTAVQLSQIKIDMLQISAIITFVEKKIREKIIDKMTRKSNKLKTRLFNLLRESYSHENEIELNKIKDEFDSIKKIIHHKNFQHDKNDKYETTFQVSQIKVNILQISSLIYSIKEQMNFEKTYDMGKEDSEPMQQSFFQQIFTRHKKKKERKINAIAEQINTMEKVNARCDSERKQNNNANYKSLLPQRKMSALEISEETDPTQERAIVQESYTMVNNDNDRQNRNSISTHSSVIFNRTKPLVIQNNSSDRDKLMSLREQIRSNYWEVGVGC